MKARQNWDLRSAQCGAQCALHPPRDPPGGGDGRRFPPAALGLHRTFQMGISNLLGTGDPVAPRWPGCKLRTPSILPQPCSSERRAPELPFLSQERKSPPCTSPCAFSMLS